MKNPERSTRTNAENLDLLIANRTHLSSSSQEFANSLIQYSTVGLSDKQWYWVDVLAGRCIDVAAEYGQRTGRCMFCRRKLTDGRSVTMGYGPVCAEKNHLPWGEVA